MGELGQLLHADAAVAQHFHGSPRPERPVFVQGEVAAGTGVGVFGPCPHADALDDPGSAQCLAGDREQLTGRGLQRCLQPLGGGGAFALDRGEQGGQDRHAFAGPLVHA